MKDLLPLIAKNPLPGDKLNSRHVTDHQTRTVIDRNFGGDVFYTYNARRGIRHEASCTIETWRRYCERARVLAVSPKHLAKRSHAQRQLSEEPKP